MKLPNTDNQVGHLTNLFIKGTEEHPLLMMLTVASLSQNNIYMICFLDQSFPHRKHETTIGYVSIKAVEEALAGKDNSSFGHVSANH